MSASVFYHGFGIRGYQYERTSRSLCQRPTVARHARPRRGRQNHRRYEVKPLGCSRPCCRARSRFPNHVLLIDSNTTVVIL